MASFIKNLKSTFLDSPSSSRKMPSRHTPNEDPFQRIRDWDDGFQYIQEGGHSMNGTPGPMYSPPPSTYAAPPPKPARRSTYEPDYVRQRHAYPSPPESDVDASRRHRRTARRSPSPPPRRRDTRREGDRYWDDDRVPRRPHLDTRFTAPAPGTRDMRSGRGSDSPRSYSRSPPPRLRRSDRRSYYRSPSPPRKPSSRYRDYPDLPRDYERQDTRPSTSRRPTATSSRYRSPSPPPSSTKKNYYPPRAGDKRPPISRSKSTTSAAAAAAARDRLSYLSPRWQKAAQAALQAGSMTAYQLRSQPGAWKGEKGARVATAALGAAAIDAFLKGDAGGRDREREGRSGGGYKTKEWSSGNSGRSRRRSEVEILGDAVGGFLADQFSKKASVR